MPKFLYDGAMRILGIDPGLATIGLGLIESANGQNVTAIEWLTIETSSADTLSTRLAEIAKDLGEYIREAQPELVVVEKLYFATNEKTAIDVAHARGVILAAVASARIPVLEPTPPQLKSCITGDGRADKKQMEKMIVTLFHLDSIPKPDDAADALALAAYGAFMGKHSLIA